jgi:hypothetical protein
VTSKPLACDEARRFAANIAKLPEVLRRSRLDSGAVAPQTAKQDGFPHHAPDRSRDYSRSPAGGWTARGRPKRRRSSTSRCDGTVKNGADDTELVRKMGLVVSIAQHTVIGFVPVAHINRLDDANVEFSGDTGSSLGGSTSVMGGIDRVTGAAWINTVIAAKDGKIIATQAYDLICKVKWTRG